MTMRSWVRNVFARPARGPVRRAPHRARLGVESLEGRAVPATFTVLNGLDAGAGSLRAAIVAANDVTINPGPDIINFDPAVTAVALTTGQLTINSDITITGGASGVTIAASQFRIFQVNAGKTAELSGLTITGGGTPVVAAAA